MNEIFKIQNISDADTVKRVKSAVKIELEKRKAMDLPIAVFDEKTGNVYAEYNDGTRILMGSKLRQHGFGE